MPAFLTQEWAQAVREAVNKPLDEQYKASKLQLYWDWVDQARNTFEGSLALGAKESDRFVRLNYSGGECKSAEVVSEPDATFALVGTTPDWQQVMGGFDTNKAIMYRKLRLEQGDVFAFFNRVYVFAEALYALSKVPTTF